MKERQPSRKRTALKIAIAGIAIAGAVSLAESVAEIATINSPIRREVGVKRDVPGYDPDTFSAMKKIADRFREQEDLTSPAIKVPEGVTQAATFVKDNQTIFDRGHQLQLKRSSRFINRFIAQFFGGFVTFAIGGLTWLNLSSFKNGQKPEKVRRNSSPAKA